MPCMCGDICCHSCGPAQGNSRCPICRAWASEGCEHFDENDNPTSPEVEKQLHDIATAEAEADALWGAQWAKEQKQIEEWRAKGLI